MILENYAISARFQKCWTDKNRPLVVQYTLKMDKPIICGGAYIKLIPDGLDQRRFPQVVHHILSCSVPMSVLPTQI
ncbi:unfolded protein binding [Trichomonas vaginalis G3]|uniref:unfolded protein binding n=1 Tax=Trichomonas vaginalis (strain ATCC PRA-98 / G3) TaxID=412133 RepID=UPI0021E5D110|nr:unfolded protein binding [Trichomonas vaginalis G3]KAI5536053.1 unfolded protein binding [Trichomonas vaginalis G3]